MVPPVEGADALEEAVAGDHVAPELARGRGVEEADGRADTQEDQLQDFIGEVVDAGPHELFVTHPCSAGLALAGRAARHP